MTDAPNPTAVAPNGPPTRRAVLGAAGLAVIGTSCLPTPAPGSGPAAPTTTRKPTPTTWPPAPAIGITAEFAIDKLTFGVKPNMVAAIRKVGVSNWIEAQLNPGPHGVPTAESRVAAYTTLKNTHRQNYDVQDSPGGYDRLIAELDHATLLRAVYSERQLYEVMCDFWANHFNTWRDKTWMTFLKTRSNETVTRRHALGKFSDMLLASATDTAMLDYLDNLPSDASQPGGVNENYARELMELHTLGIVNGQQVHTEADVRGVARVMSGWSINWNDTAQRYNFAFLPWQHSLEPVSGLIGGAFSRPARSYGQGYDDGVRLIKVLAHHPATARHIATKLCCRFVSDSPSASLVASTAAVFTANDTAIAPTLRHIFHSAEFAASRRRKMRRPFEHVVACLRGLNASIPTGTTTQAAESGRWLMEQLGQPLFGRQSPDGYPDVNRYWASSEAMLQRWSVAGRIARNQLTNPHRAGAISVSLTKLLPTPLPPTVAALISWMARALGNYSMPAGDVTEMCTQCGVSPNAPASAIASNPEALGLAVGLVLSHPIFQTR